MARLSYRTLAIVCTGWLSVAGLVSVLGWRAYRNDVKSWESRSCTVIDSKVENCGEANGYRVQTTVQLDGEKESRRTLDDKCD